MNVICLLPVKDEAAQLDRFVQAASLWATHILVADQNSTDGTPDIARRYSKVQLIQNSSDAYNERSRQELLIAAARGIPGPRLLIALDADELLTANVLHDAQWQQVLTAAPGTCIYFDWVNLLPDLQTGWIAHTGSPWGYVDDGKPHTGTAIHSPRVPFDESAPRIRMQAVKVLHYQYADWKLMKRKQMWYQCWELLHSLEKRASDIHRIYHHMDAIDGCEKVAALPEWFDAYEKAGIAVRQIRPQSTDKWDLRILDFLLAEGAGRFAKLDIWSVNWAQRLRELRPADAGRADELVDPRRGIDRGVMRYLRQAHRRRNRDFTYKVARRLIKPLGW